VGRAPPEVAVGPLGRGERVLCKSKIFILNETSVQDKIYSLVGTLLGLKMLLATVLALNKTHFIAG
jgi:hypothetical protein